MLERPGVLDLFAEQFDVAADAQLHELGVSDRTVRRAVSRGVVLRPVPRVLWLPGRPESIERRAMTIQLSMSGAGFVSGLSAGALHGWSGTAAPGLHYTVHERRRLDRPPWLHLHVTSWMDTEPRLPRADGLVLASPDRTIFDIAAHVSDSRFAWIAESAWRRGDISPASLAAYVARVRRSGRAGSVRIDRWLDLVDRRSTATESGLELFVEACAVAAGLPAPVRQYPLTLHNGIVVHLDLAWPDLRWAIEPGHSWWHGGDAAVRRDHERDRWCAALGWLITRFDESARGRRPAVVRELREIHERRRDEVTLASA